MYVCVCARAYASLVARTVTYLPANAGSIRDTCSVLGLGRSTGKGNGNPLQNYCCINIAGIISWTEESGGL